jgi:acyl-CoA reductase-like NAD-dependent aldehyde dehydrogenase
VAREVLAEYGLLPRPGRAGARGRKDEGLAKTLALRPEVKIIDFTGSNEFGDWLEDNARQAQVYTEKAGINTIVVDSFREEEYQAALGAPGLLALALHRADVHDAAEHPRAARRHEGGRGREVLRRVRRRPGRRGRRSCSATTGRAAAILGAVVNPFILERLAKAEGVGKTVLASRAVTHPEFPEATVRTPLIAAIDAEDAEVYTHEWFGPISFLIATDSTAHSIELYRSTVKAHGALTAAVYSTDEAVMSAAEEATWEAGANLSINLTGRST